MLKSNKVTLSVQIRYYLAFSFSLYKGTTDPNRKSNMAAA